MKRFPTSILSILLLIWHTHCSAQIITTMAGNGTSTLSGNGGPATAAGISVATGIAFDAGGNLYITSWTGTSGVPVNAVRKVSPSGFISVYAGNDSAGYSGDGGPATAAKLSNPRSICFDRYGNGYIADGTRVRKVDAAGIITTFAGNGTTIISGDGGPATAAGIATCQSVCCDTAGLVVYIGSPGGQIRRVDSTGIITTFAGLSGGGYSGDGGPASAARLIGNGQMVFDSYNNLFFADVGNQRIRKINAAGIVTTIAGTGAQGYSGVGGPATAAMLYSPNGVFPDKCGNVYIADSWNNRIRVVNGAGIIKTFAGTGFGGGVICGGKYGGDGGPATAADLNYPFFICLDKTGSMYIADFCNVRVRYVYMDSCRNTVDVPDISGSEDEGLRVYPNPSNGTFKLYLTASIEQPAKVTIMDITGRVVTELVTTTNKATEVALHVPPGMYLVCATTSEGRYVRRMEVGSR